jgi:hypothetical protein
MTDVTGLPLSQAMAIGEKGARIEETKSPRHPREEGTLRVVRVRDGVWTVARFPDHVKEQA